MFTIRVSTLSFASLLAFGLIAPACERPLAEPPPLIAPLDLLPEDEPVFMHAHYDKMLVDMMHNLGRRYEDREQVEFEFDRLSMQLHWWHKDVGHPDRWLGAEMQYAQYQRTPDARHYRGARKRALALGQLAFSLWRRTPGQGRPTPGDMDLCANKFRRPKCPLDSRTVCLERFVRMGMGADRELFLKLVRRGAKLEARLRAERQRKDGQRKDGQRKGSQDEAQRLNTE